MKCNTGHEIKLDKRVMEAIIPDIKPFNNLKIKKWKKVWHIVLGSAHTMPDRIYISGHFLPLIFYAANRKVFRVLKFASSICLLNEIFSGTNF